MIPVLLFIRPSQEYSIMVLSKEDKAIIKACYENFGWGGRKIAREFESKKWSHVSVNAVIKKIKNNESIERKKGSGRPRTVNTQENVDLVKELACSQDDSPGTHLSQRQISDRLNLSRHGVRNCMKSLKIKPFKRIRTSRKPPSVRQKRKTRARRLLDKFTAAEVHNIVFTDEKNFTLEIPLNKKNDVVYGTKVQQATQVISQLPFLRIKTLISSRKMSGLPTPRI